MPPSAPFFALHRSASRIAALCAISLVVSVLRVAAAPPALAVEDPPPALGGQLYSTGGPVTIEVLSASAGLTSQLFLLDPEEVSIASNREVGRQVTVGPYPNATELVFGIRVQGQEYRLGPANRNPDGIEHAVVDFGPDGCAVVGFEDLFGGGDRDYDDNRFRFCGGIAPDPEVPEDPPTPDPVGPPAADAGPDQSVPEGSVVTLDGSGSHASTKPSLQPSEQLGTLPGGTSMGVNLVELDPNATVPTATGSVEIGQGPQAQNTSIAYVVDVSGSTSDSASCGGDANGDGASNRVLDCEVAAAMKLHEKVVAAGTVDKVALVQFSSGASARDLDPTSGTATLISPTADKDNDGVLDLVEGLRMLRSGGGTNFAPAASVACSLLATTGSPNLVGAFLSDGQGSGNLSQVVPCNPPVVFKAFAAGSGSSCNAGPAGSRLADLARLSGGTCLNVPNVENLPDILPEVISSTITKVEYTLDGGNPVDISPSLDLPLAGPGEAGFRIELPADLAGSHRLCVTVTGRDAGGVSSETTCSDVVTVTGELTYDWRQVESEGPPVFLSSRKTAHPSFVAPDDGTYVFELTISDGTGGTATDRVTVDVTNLDPVLEIEPGAAYAGGVTQITGTLTDEGWQDTHVVSFDWGDGTVDEVEVTTRGAGWGSFFGSHVYRDAGTYHAVVTLLDDDGGRDVADLSGFEVGTPVAVWANSTSLDRSLDWSGGAGNIHGRVHTNGQLRFIGASKSVVGPSSYAGRLSADTTRNSFTPAPVQAPVQDFPIEPDIAAFRPGGAVALEVGPAYHDMSSRCVDGSWHDVQNVLASGVYYASCDIQLNGSDIGGRVTLVSERHVKIAGSRPAFEPYADGLLVVAGASGPAAIDISTSTSKFLGVLFAGSGEISISGAGNRFYCGILGDQVRITGTDVDIRGATCGRPDATVAHPVVVPQLTAELAVDRSDALPSDTLGYSVDVTNEGTTVVVPALVGLENVDTLATTVAGYSFALERQDATTGEWSVLAAKGDPRLRIDLRPNAYPGVTYAAGGDVAGTGLPPGAWATWGLQAVLDLSPAESAELFDPAATSGLRTRVDFTLDPAGVQARRLYTIGDDFLGALRDLTPDVTAASATVVLPSGEAETRDADDEPALATIAPGETATLTDTWDVPVPAARSATETDAGYLSRLLAQDGTRLNAASFVLASGGVGRLVAPLSIVTTTRHVPVVGISTTGPEHLQAGSSADYAIDLANLGSSPASDLATTATAGDVALTVSGAPGALEPGESAQATTPYAAPTGQSGPVGLRSEVTWTDARGNEYGAQGSTLQVVRQTPAQLGASLVDALQVDADGNGSVGPGDTVRYTLTVRNTGGAALTGVTATVPVDENTALVPGSGQTPDGGTVALDGGQAEVTLPDVAGGASRRVHFDVRVADPFPNGVVRIQAQGTVRAAGHADALSDDPALPGAADPTRTNVTVPRPALAGFLGGHLVIDADGSGTVTPGDTLAYQLQVNSVGTQAVDSVVATVPTPPGTTLVPGSVTSTEGTVADGPAVDVSLGTLAPFQEAVIRFRLAVDKPLPAGVTTVSARAELRSAQLPVQYSDDTTTVEVGDPTVIPVGEPGAVDPEKQGPVLTGLGPAEGTTVTEPVHITADLAAPDGAALDSWVVDYRLAGDTAATVIGTGTGNHVDAVLDPTVMPNGTYVVSVRGSTVGGGLTTRDITVVVEGDLKLGRYQTTVTDMSVGVAGLPIQVNRSYDSFDKATGDFGVGWTVDLANFKVSSNGRLGEGGWTMAQCGGGLIFVPLCFSSDRPHFVTVTWPDGHNEYFDLTPAKTWSFIPGMTTAQFTARAGSTSTLQAADPSLFLFGDNLEGGFFGSDGVYDPRQFVLTDRFGTKYTLEVGVGLKRVEETSGAVTTFSRDGITSSRGPGVDFVRDAQGRITKVTGPDGRTVLYGYDAAGDLTSVTDQAGKVTSLGYLPGHYLDRVTGPGGAAMARFEYTDGRLTAVIDGEGNRTEVSSSVDARQETVTDPGGRRTTIKSYDADGLLVSVNEVYGGAAHVTEYEYDADRNITLRRDPLGHEWRSTYADGNITSITLPSGAKTEMTYNDLGQPLTWTDAEGGTTTYAWNPNGTLASVTDPLGHAETYTYNASGLRTGKTDRNGEVWAWTYTAEGLVSTQTDPLGGVTRYEYDNAGRQTAVVDPAGNRTETAYDASGNTIRVTDPDGAVRRTEFDDLNRVLREIDPMGHAVDYTYDGAGRTTRVDNHVDAPTDYEYDALGRATSVTVGSRPAARTTYDGAGHVLARTDQVGRTTSYAYYADGSLHTETNPAGGVTTYTYTPDGKVASVEEPTGGVTRYTYTPTGKVKTVTNPVEAVTTHEYDAAGRLTATVHPDGSRTERTYDDAGNLSSTTDQNGETTTFELDALGRRVAIVDPEGRRTETTYDQAGRATRVKAPDGGETVSVFSPGGRLLSSTTPEGVRTSYGYNAKGLLTSTTDELGHTWSTTYDPLGRVLTERDPRQQSGSPTVTNAYNAFGELVSTTDVAGNRVSFGYDAAGQRTSVTDPRGKVWSVAYGLLGGVVTETDPLDRERTTEYDDAGRTSRTVDQRGVAVGYDYDAAGRLVTVDNEGGAGDITIGYDELGRRTSMTDATGSTTWTYLPDGAVSGVESPAGVVGYTYDRSGRRLTMTQPAGTVAYAYDGAGRLAEVTDWDGRTFGTTFDRDGRIAALVRPNGVRSEWSYDDAGRLTGLRHLRNGAVVERAVYTLDADGNRTSMTSSAGVETYTLNALDQLTAVTYPNGSTTTYTYDAAGNRLTSKRGSDPVVTYTYDDASQLTSVGGSAVTHDAAGNVTGAQGTTYDWDWLQRLVRVDGGGHTSTFGYDGDGVRTIRTVDGATEELLYDRAAGSGLPELIADGDESFLQLLGGVLEQDGSTTLYPLADALGSVRALTDPSGATVGTASYDVFGAVRSSSGTDSDLGFTGAPQSGDLVHLNARDLSTSLGAFLSTDPVRPGSPGVVGWNPYSYVANNPTTWTDPSGQFALAGYAISAGLAIELAAIALLALGILLYLQEVLKQSCLYTGSCTIDPPWGGNNGSNGGNSGGGGGTDVGQLAQRYLSGTRVQGLTQAMAEAAAAACIGSNIAAMFPGINSPCNAGVRILFVGGVDLPGHEGHVRDVLSSNPAKALLHRRFPVPTTGRSWYRSDPICKAASAAGDACDEYPFFSTKEGGPGASLRAVPRDESNRQGALLSGFYGSSSCQPFSDNTPFFAVPVVASVSFHYCHD